ncbi:MAG TPA: putative inorganic carbon transporter subunit DabA, partial [Gammaproteobacteria bacterium]|nr:putative inorganic carbon transporter subunit DabA [Gammaproteobacteria bacterium]
VHEPMRLSVFIEAPREEIDRVIGTNEMVNNLVSHEWLHLFQIDDEGTAWRRHPQGSWVPAPGTEEPAAALAG